MADSSATKKQKCKTLMPLLDNLCDENPIKMEYILDGLFSGGETSSTSVYTKAGSFQKMLQNELYDQILIIYQHIKQMRTEGETFKLSINKDIEAEYPYNIKEVRNKIYQLYEDFGKNGTSHLMKNLDRIIIF